MFSDLRTTPSEKPEEERKKPSIVTWTVQNTNDNYTFNGQTQPVVNVAYTGGDIQVIVSIEVQNSGVKLYQRIYLLEAFQQGNTKLYLGPVCPPGHYDLLYVGIYKPIDPATGKWGTLISDNHLGSIDIT